MSLWTVDDKRALLFALHQFGPGNIAALQRALPNKTIVEIECACQEYSKLAIKKSTEKNKDASIKRWLQILKRLRSTQQGQLVDVIPRALKYIALFEKRVHSKNIDIGACYISLQFMANGLAPEELNKTTKYFIFECISRLANCLKYGEVRSYKKYLAELKTIKDLHVHRKNYKCKIESSLILNPLGIPYNFMLLPNTEASNSQA